MIDATQSRRAVPTFLEAGSSMLPPRSEPNPGEWKGWPRAVSADEALYGATLGALVGGGLKFSFVRRLDKATSCPGVF
jgi:hypothetical protein